MASAEAVLHFQVFSIHGRRDPWMQYSHRDQTANFLVAVYKVTLTEEMLSPVVSYDEP